MDFENIEILLDDKTVHKTKLHKPLNNSELIKILRNPWPAWLKNLISITEIINLIFCSEKVLY